MGKNSTKRTFTEEDMMNLRIATINYKISNKIKSNSKLIKDAGLTCGRADLPRFLSGDTNDFGDRESLIKFLQNKNYWPINNAANLLYNAFSSFSSSSTVSSSSEILRSIAGSHEYYQWSSTSPGEVTISRVDITLPGDNDANFAIVSEQQINSEKSKMETYEGCCFCTNNGVIFITRETQKKRLKFVICDSITEERMYGITLKESSLKSIHLSNVYLKPVSIASDIKPRFEFFDRLDDSVKAKLQEPLTSFNLTWKAKMYIDARKEIIALMEGFVVNSGDTDEE